MPRSMFSLTETPDLCYVTAVIVGSEFESAKTAGTCQWAAPKIMNPSDLTNSEEGNKFPKSPENNDMIVYFPFKKLCIFIQYDCSI